MKKNFIKLSLVMAIFAASTSSCNMYRSASDATSVGQLSSNPFVQNIAKRLMTDLTNMLVQQGLNKAIGGLNLKTPLSGILSTAGAVSGFKNILSSNYKVPTQVVENNFGSFQNLGGVVGFLAKNANINF
jgi:hypothetical protein